MNLDKCKFNIVEFIFLGHKISVSRIAPDDPRIQKIMEMLEPNDKKRIQRLYGFINHVEKLLPKLTEGTSPLRELL